MTEVKSTNIYELLGNDRDLDSDKEPEPPVKAVDRAGPRKGPRNGPKEPLVEPHGERTGRARRGGFGGNEGAFQDRGAGRDRNRDKPTDEGDYDRSARFGEGGRGGRGRGRGRGGARFDRHPNRSGIAEHPKQAEHGWGATSGEGEWNDEQAATDIAKAEQNEVTAPVDEPAPEAESMPPSPGFDEVEEFQEKPKTLDDYLAEQAQKRLELGETALEPRKPNEGRKEDKKWAQAKQLVKDEEADQYIAGTYEKKHRMKERKHKETVDVDLRFAEPPRERGGHRGGRGGHRGDFRGRGRGRGDYRGGRTHREGPAPNVSDEYAFPSLGA